MSQVDLASGQDQNASGVVKQEVSYETHKRLLSQLKNAQEKLSQLETEKNTFEVEKQKLEGKKDEVISLQEKQIAELKKNVYGAVKNFSERTIKGEVVKEALSRGIQKEKLDKFLKLTEESFLKSPEIQIDENFNIVNREVFERIMEKEVTDNADWFSKPVNPPRDFVPNGKPINAPQKRLEDMTTDELADLL